jgi:hypothetical protein
MTNYNGKLSNFLKSSPDSLSENGGKPGLPLKQVGNIQGLFIKPNQLITLSLSIPDKNNNDGNGYSIMYASNDNNLMLGQPSGSYEIVKSSKVFDKKQGLGSNVLLAMFDRPFPYKLNDIANLKLAISGKNGGSSNGHLYIGDNFGASTAIPVYLNYALIAEPNVLSAKKNGGKVSFTLANVSDKNYNRLEITGLPADADLSNGALSSLRIDEQRRITLDLSDVNEIGSYDIVIKGISDDSQANDIQHVSLTITKGW